MKEKVFSLTSFLFFVVLGFLFSFTSVNAQVVNLIQNPSLETAGTNATPLNWKKDGWGTPKPTYKYPDIGRSATDKSFSITLSKNSTGDARLSPDPVSVVAGETYTYSNWYKSAVATEINAEYTNSAGKLSYAFIATVPASTSWKQVTATIKIPAGVTKAKIYHLIKKKGTLTVDDFYFAKVGDTTPPVPPAPTTTPPVPPTPPTVWDAMVSITFDDSWISQYTNALPILEKAGMKGTFYITTEPLIEKWDEFMNPTQVKDIANKGHEIGGHTVTHPHLPELSDTEVTKEITDSKKYLETLIGRSVTALAYPFGEFNSTVKNLIKTAGYTTARGVQGETLNTPTTDKYNLQSPCLLKNTPFATVKKSIDDAKSKKQWYILCFHEIKNNGTAYSVSIAQFQQIIDYIKSSGIKVVTVNEGTAMMAN